MGRFFFCLTNYFKLEKNRNLLVAWVSGLFRCHFLGLWGFFSVFPCGCSGLFFGMFAVLWCRGRPFWAEAGVGMTDSRRVGRGMVPIYVTWINFS